MILNADKSETSCTFLRVSKYKFAFGDSASDTFIVPDPAIRFRDWWVQVSVGGGEFSCACAELTQNPMKQIADKNIEMRHFILHLYHDCLLYTSPSPRDKRQSRMPSSA